MRRHAEVSRQRPIVPDRRQLDLVRLVGGEPVEVGDVELGVLVALGDLLEPIVERLVAGLEGVLAVVAVDPQHEVLRRQPVVPVDDRDRAGVVVAEPLQRRQRGGDARGRALLGEQPLVGHPGVQPDLLGDERTQVGRHVAVDTTLTSAVRRARSSASISAPSRSPSSLSRAGLTTSRAETSATVSISTRPFWRRVSPVWVMSTMRSHRPVSGPSSIAPDSLMTSAVMPLRWR